MSDRVPPNFVFGQSTAVTSKVGDLDIDFYPVSVGMMLRLKGMIGPIAKAIATLTSSNSKDTGSVSKEDGAPYVLEDGTPMTQMVGNTMQMVRDVETSIKPIDPSLARFRSEERTGAINELMVAFGDERNVGVIGDICQDSMQVPEANRVDGAKFMETVEAPDFYDIVAGVAKANKGVFGPLADMMGPGLDRLKDYVDPGQPADISARSEPVEQGTEAAPA